MALPDWVADPLNPLTPPDNVPGGLAAREIRALKKRVNELNSDDIANESILAGDSVTSVLDSLITALQELVASEVGNDSGVFGTTVKDALDTLAERVSELKASEITNDSEVEGATVKDALNNLGHLAYGQTWETVDSAAGSHTLTVPAPTKSRMLQVNLFARATEWWEGYGFIGLGIDTTVPTVLGQVVAAWQSGARPGQACTVLQEAGKELKFTVVKQQGNMLFTLRVTELKAEAPTPDPGP